jgi:hypothetical protein
MIIVPGVQVYRNISKDQYVVQELAAFPEGGSVHFGQPIIVTAEGFDCKIAGLILNCLKNYRKSDCDQRLVHRSSDKERRRFVKEHLLVDVAQISPTQLRVSPCERHGISYSGVKGAAVTLELGSAEKELPNALREVFRKAR